MSEDSTKIILGRERFKSAIDVDTYVNLELQQNTKLLTEYDRSVDLNLENLFDQERESSTTFRPVTKYTILFSNALTGSTTYVPFRDNLYYTNELQNTITAFPGSGNVPPPLNPPPMPSAWNGFPQYFEFDFIRNDNNVVGYTQPPNNHINFKNVSASTYNWNHYISYPFENDGNKTLNTIIPKTNISWVWIASQGIPFYITVGSNLTTRQIRFYCPMPHGLTAGEYVELSFNYNGNNLFQVTSLGDNGYGSDEYIFNIANVGFIGTTFNTGVQGFFKRVINNTNVAETRSQYYIRRHKIITEPKCKVLANAGFDQNIFNSKPKFEIYALTPTQQSRSSVKEGSQSYTLSFNCDIDIAPLRDNQKRPITQLFFTTIWRGYFGWTRNMKQGWEFNTPLRPNSAPQSWWDQSNPLSSNTNIAQLNYSVGPIGPFYYNETLVSGDTIDGAFCEWNNYDQNERVISDYVHKLKYNNQWFTVVSNYLPPSNQYGYFYKPHAPIQIREFSNYVEEGVANKVVDIPDWAFFSQLSNSFRWRDIYPYGFTDEDGLGVDYPFLNGKHYPYTDTIFRITPENFNIASPYTQGYVPQDITTITDPIIDECE